MCNTKHEKPIVGIIAEYNPFHNGHKWQLGEIRRRLGTDTAIIAVMSGNFTQRGDTSFLNKNSRAEAAVRGGISLVVELPVAHSLASAEGFATAGIHLLNAMGIVSHLAFGCECTDERALSAALDVIDSPKFISNTDRYHESGCTRPNALRLAAAEYPEIQKLLSGANNALALEYLRALRRSDSKIIPVGIPRIGVMHDGKSPEIGFASASFIRALCKFEDADLYMPSDSFRISSCELCAGRAPVHFYRNDQTVIAYLRRLSTDKLSLLPDICEGLENRLFRAIRENDCIETILSAVKTKRYTLARLRRLIVCAYVGITANAQRLLPQYIRVLAMDAQGAKLLNRMKTSAALPLISKPAAALKWDGQRGEQFALEASADDLYAMFYPEISERRAGITLTRSPIFIS